jgi:hypothetical protein
MRAKWACTTRQGSGPVWCTLSGASWIPKSTSSAQTPSFFLENFHDIFPQIYFRSYLHKKDKNELSAKNNDSFSSFYPRVGSLPDKT